MIRADRSPLAPLPPPGTRHPGDGAHRGAGRGGRHVAWQEIRRTARRRAATALAGVVAAAASAGCGTPAPGESSPGTAAPTAGRAAAVDGSGAAADPVLADSIAALLGAAYDFASPDFVARVMRLYPAGDPVIAAAAGRVTTSRAALQLELQRFWEQVGQNMREPRLVVGARHAVRLGPDAAAFTGTYAIPHRTPEGRPHTLAGAWTFVLRRAGAGWVIVHEHLSDVPRPVPRPDARPPATPGGAER